MADEKDLPAEASVKAGKKETKNEKGEQAEKKTRQPKQEPKEEIKEEKNEQPKEKAEVKDDKKKTEKEEKKQGTTINKYEDIKPGMTVRVYQRIKELDAKGAEKERVQYFEGLVIGRKHGKEKGSTITVRKVTDGVGVEKIFPLQSPTIEKINVLKIARVRRAKLHFLRGKYKKRLREKKA